MNRKQEKKPKQVKHSKQIDKDNRGGANKRSRRAFILPAVVIASVIMLALLAVSLNLAVISSNSLKDQYYDQLAKEAAEAGSVRMAECIKKGFFDTSKTITPSSDCEGNNPGGYVLSDGSVRTTYEAKYVSQGEVKSSSIIGKVELLRSSDSAVYKTYSYTQLQQVNREIDTAASRASARWWYFGQNAKLDFGASGEMPGVGLPTVGSISSTSTFGINGVTTASDKSGNPLFYYGEHYIRNGLGQEIPEIPGGATNHNPGCYYDYPEYVILGAKRLCASWDTQGASFPINKSGTKYVTLSNIVNNVNKDDNMWYAHIIKVDPANPSSSATLTDKNILLGGNNPRDWSPSGLSRYAGETVAVRPNLEGNGATVYTYGYNRLKMHVFAFKVYSDDDGNSIKTPPPYIYTYNFSSCYDMPICHRYRGPHVHSRRGTHLANHVGRYKPSARRYSPSMRKYSAIPAGAWQKLGNGTIKFSKDYTKMILYAGGQNNGPNSCNGGISAGQLFLFDISGGDTSMNLIARWKVTPQASNDDTEGFSADFSPSGRYVYASTIDPGELYRYDISSGNATTIKNSERFIGYTHCALMTSKPCEKSYSETDWLGRLSTGGGQVLRGPDGRMYVANATSRYISYVESPDASSGAKVARPVAPTTTTPTATSVGWNYGGLTLPAGTRSHYYLPQTVVYYSPKITNY